MLHKKKVFHIFFFLLNLEDELLYLKRLDNFEKKRKADIISAKSANLCVNLQIE